MRATLILLIALGFSGQVSWTCTCGRSAPGACADFKETGISFVGTVIEIQNPPDERRGADQSGTSRYRFHVDEKINGIVANEVDIYSGRGGADCSYHFQLGEKYFVTPYSDDGQLFATICSDTQPAANAGPLLSELRALRDGKPYASVYGVLRKTQQPYVWTAADGFERPLPGMTVEMRSAERTFTAQTDEQGIYRFYGLPAGTYKFAATLPATLELAQTILSDPLPPLTVPEDACYQQDLDALPTGRIRGRLLGSDGMPLQNGDVALFRADRYNENDMGWWEYQDVEKGYFEFEHVSPGTFVIVFHNSNRPDPDIPYARAFYPGSSDLKSAIPINLEEGQQILNADIHLTGVKPTRLLTLRVEGIASEPRSVVLVWVHGADGNDAAVNEVSPGVFESRVFRGVHYTVYGEQDCGQLEAGDTLISLGRRETERIEIDGSDDRTPVVSLSLRGETCKPHQPKD